MAKAKEKTVDREAFARSLVERLQKKLGDKGDVTVMGDGLFAAEPKEFVSTGIELLDWGIGGGLPFGKIVEIFGTEQVGKTTLGLNVLGNAQRNHGAIATLWDGEQATTLDFAKKLSTVNVGELIHPDVWTLEDMFESLSVSIDDAAESMRKEKIDIPQVHLIDSLPIFPPQKEAETPLDEQGASALAARVIRQAWRKLTRKIAHERVLAIFTNHETANIIHGWAPPGTPKWTTYGGTGGKFGASVRLRLQFGGYLKVGKTQVGTLVKATIIKNRFERPMTVIHYPIYWDRGVDNEASMLHYVLEHRALEEEEKKDERTGRKKKTGKYLFGGTAFDRTELLDKLHTDKALRADFTKHAKSVFMATRMMVPPGEEAQGEVAPEDEIPVEAGEA